jgi:hypothetical protein
MIAFHRLAYGMADPSTNTTALLRADFTAEAVRTDSLTDGSSSNSTLGRCESFSRAVPS